MELQGSYSDIRAEDAELLAISVDSMEDAERMVAHANAEFPVLSDADATVSRAYQVYDLLGDGLAAPSVFILDGSGALLGGYVGESASDRIRPADILQVLRGD